ncbi:SAF domain-containing protein [Phytoactinopolyspora halophila]|nr:SAF domain-containing protein [Phytoactinopolyspora halophila]
MAISTSQTSDSQTDRQRTREERGVRSTKGLSGGGGDRIPTPPRQRRPALAALAVLLIVGGATVAAILAMRADERVPVLMVQSPVEAGEQITEEHLGTTQVASEGTLLIPASQMDRVVGQYSTVRISEGQLLDTSMLGGSGMLVDGHAAVGASLEIGRYPASGLRPGDIVDLIAVRSDGGGEVISQGARVSSVSGGGDGGADSTVSSGIQATFIVPAAERATVASWAANNGLAVAVIERGAAVDDDAPSMPDAEDGPTDDDTGESNGDADADDEEG